MLYKAEKNKQITTNTKDNQKKNRKRRFNAIPVTQNSTWHESRWKRMRTMEVRAGFGKAQNSRVWSAIVRKALVAFKP